MSLMCSDLPKNKSKFYENLFLLYKMADPGEIVPDLEPDPTFKKKNRVRIRPSKINPDPEPT